MSFLSYIQKYTPKSGRVIREDGEIVNVGDVMQGIAARNIWPFGETLVGQKVDDMSLQFQYPFVNTEFDFRPADIIGDGQVVQADSLLQVSSTTGSALIESIGSTSYRPGHSGYIDFTAAFIGSGQAIVGGKNAFQIRYDDGVLSFGYVKGGVFNGVAVDTSGLDLTKLNIWRIVYGYLGSASPVLFVKKGIYRQVAIVETEGVLPGTHIDDPNFSAIFQTIGGCTLKSGSYAAGVIDGCNRIGFRSFLFPDTPIVSGTGAAQGDVVLNATNVSTLVVFRSKETYQTLNNSVRSFLTLWENYVESPPSGSGDVVFQIIANPTLSGAPAYVDVDANSSVMQYDHAPGTGASVSYVSGGRVILQKQLPYAAGQGNRPGVATFSSQEAEQLGAAANAGDVFAAVAKDNGGNGVTVRSSIAWRERF